MVFVDARVSLLRGRPPRWADGISGSTRAHSAACRSLGYLSLSLAGKSDGTPPVHIAVRHRREACRPAKHAIRPHAADVSPRPDVQSVPQPQLAATFGLPSGNL